MTCNNDHRMTNYYYIYPFSSAPISPPVCTFTTPTYALHEACDALPKTQRMPFLNTFLCHIKSSVSNLFLHPQTTNAAETPLGRALHQSRLSFLKTNLQTKPPEYLISSTCFDCHPTLIIAGRYRRYCVDQTRKYCFQKEEAVIRETFPKALNLIPGRPTSTHHKH